MRESEEVAVEQGQREPIQLDTTPKRMVDSFFKFVREVCFMSEGLD